MDFHINVHGCRRILSVDLRTGASDFLKLDCILLTDLRRDISNSTIRSESKTNVLLRQLVLEREGGSLPSASTCPIRQDDSIPLLGVGDEFVASPSLRMIGAARPEISFERWGGTYDRLSVIGRQERLLYSRNRL
jgi:hypothetical protein